MLFMATSSAVWRSGAGGAVTYCDPAASLTLTRERECGELRDGNRDDDREQAMQLVST